MSAALSKRLSRSTIKTASPKQEARYKVYISARLPAEQLKHSKKSGTMIRRAQDQLLSQWPDIEERMIRRYQSIPVVLVSLHRKEIEAMNAHHTVEHLDLMESYKKVSNESHPLTGTDLAHAAYGGGTGTTIAIIDDGVQADHPAFGAQAGFPTSKIIGGFDFGDSDADPRNDCLSQNHGTAVAGIAAGNGGGITGVAPDASLVFLKIQSSGSCGSSVLDGDLVGAIDWASTNQALYNINVLSMSLGAGSFNSIASCEASSFAITSAIDAASAAGITVLAASGNDGTCDAMSRPACVGSAISVGAVYDADVGTPGFCVASNSCAPGLSPNSGCSTGWAAFETNTSADQVTLYSNSASFLDLLAPANCALTADTGSGTRTCFGGTSAATPFAAGVAALTLALNPTLSPPQVRDLLKNNGATVTDPRNARVTSRVDAFASTNAAAGNPNENCTDGQDNDLDGDTDCADSDCAAHPSCAAPPPSISIQTLPGSSATIDIAGREYYTAGSNLSGNSTGSSGTISSPSFVHGGGQGGAQTGSVWSFTDGGGAIDSGFYWMVPNPANRIEIPLLSAAGGSTARIYLNVLHFFGGSNTYTISTQGAQASFTQSSNNQELREIVIDFSGSITVVIQPTGSINFSDFSLAGVLLEDQGPPPSNQAPQVSAGADQSAVAGATTTLAGVVSDDGLPNPPAQVSLQWTQISGPEAGLFSDPSIATPTFTAGLPGSYVLRLTADDGALSAFDEMTVVYSTPVNQPPVVNVGPDLVTSAFPPIVLQASVTDDGFPNPPGQVSLQWTVVSSPSGSGFFSDPAVLNPQFFFPVNTPGTYVLRLTADDGAATAFDELTVTVQPFPPTITVNNLPGSSATIDVTGREYFIASTGNSGNINGSPGISAVNLVHAPGAGGAEAGAVWTFTSGGATVGDGLYWMVPDPSNRIVVQMSGSIGGAVTARIYLNVLHFFGGSNTYRITAGASTTTIVHNTNQQSLYEIEVNFQDPTLTITIEPEGSVNFADFSLGGVTWGF